MRINRVQLSGFILAQLELAGAGAANPLDLGDAITRKHYITPEALDTARANRLAEALEPKPSGLDLNHLESLLRQLAPEHLESLIASIANGR